VSRAGVSRDDVRRYGSCGGSTEMDVQPAEAGQACRWSERVEGRRRAGRSDDSSRLPDCNPPAVPSARARLRRRLSEKLSPTSPLRDAVETFVRREDAERFIEEVQRGAFRKP